MEINDYVSKYDRYICVYINAHKLINPYMYVMRSVFISSI